MANLSFRDQIFNMGNIEFKLWFHGPLAEYGKSSTNEDVSPIRNGDFWMSCEFSVAQWCWWELALTNPTLKKVTLMFDMFVCLFVCLFSVCEWKKKQSEIFMFPKCNTVVSSQSLYFTHFTFTCGERLIWLECYSNGLKPPPGHPLVKPQKIIVFGLWDLSFAQNLPCIFLIELCLLNITIKGAWNDGVIHLFFFCVVDTIPVYGSNNSGPKKIWQSAKCFLFSTCGVM